MPAEFSSAQVPRTFYGGVRLNDKQLVEHGPTAALCTRAFALGWYGCVLECNAPARRGLRLL